MEVPRASNGARPLAQLPRVYLLKVRPGRAPAEEPRGPLVALDSKRRLLAPGVYRLTSHVVVESDLSDEQLLELFERPDSAPKHSEDDPERKLSRERVMQLTEAYRAKLGEPPANILSAMGTWFSEFGETIIRDAIIETAAAIVSRKLETVDERYQFLRATLGHRRSQLRKKPPKP